jgi:hypothetical protein
MPSSTGFTLLVLMVHSFQLEKNPRLVFGDLLRREKTPASAGAIWHYVAQATISHQFAQSKAAGLIATGPEGGTIW